MNEWLAQVYGTNGAEVEPQAQEEQAKLANLELFAKIAAKHNVDLSTLSDEQVQGLYYDTFPEDMPKTAEEGELPPQFMKKKDKKEDEKEDEEDEEKKEGAAAYVQEKQATEEAFREKVAEADYMGRVMAHAYTQERMEIEKSAAAGQTREAPASTLEQEEEKSAAAQFEELSAKRAIEIAKAAEYNPEVAQQRVSAVYTLGLGETEKIASVQNVDQALHIRGLEYLEAAGYPVNWDEIFGENN